MFHYHNIPYVEEEQAGEKEEEAAEEKEGKVQETKILLFLLVIFIFS